MKLVKYRDPFAGFIPFRSLDRMFGDFLSDSFWGTDSLRAVDPPIDVYEKDGEIVLSAELPGMSKDDIDINVEGNTVTLRGERKHKDEVKDEHYHRIERLYGSFERSFTLPASADTNKISAEYKNGILKLRIPKLDEAKPKRISVKVG
ncbi:MAG: Hsp20/alpha crystallin family protein [bacterium]